MTGSSEKSEILHRSEVVFLRTSNKVIAPFTLFTIPLTDNTSVLILVEVSIVAKFTKKFVTSLFD